MIYVGILAGGKGERLSHDLPKQFISVCGKPIIYYPLKTFCSIDKVDSIIISCNKHYIYIVKDIIRSLPQSEKIQIVEGGDTRHNSILNIIKHIKEKGFSSNDIFLIHEAARPLISTDIINEHIKYLNKWDATNTLFGVIDTMMISKGGKFIDKILMKRYLYHGQTPQGYKLGSLMTVLESEVTKDDIRNEVDLCAIYIRGKKKVKIIKGNEKLFKITFLKDLFLLQYYIDNDRLLT